MIAEIHQLKRKSVETNYMCSACGEDASCNCGAPLMSKAALIRDALEADPDKPNKQIAREIGAEPHHVRRERKKLEGDHGPPPLTIRELDKRDGEKPNQDAVKACGKIRKVIAEFNHTFEVWMAAEPELSNRDREELVWALQESADWLSRMAQTLR